MAAAERGQPRGQEEVRDILHSQLRGSGPVLLNIFAKCQFLCFQIFDTGVKVVDRNCADISFPEVFLFSNLPPDFSLKLEVFSYRLRGEAGGGAR